LEMRESRSYRKSYQGHQEAGGKWLTLGECCRAPFVVISADSPSLVWWMVLPRRPAPIHALAHGPIHAVRTSSKSGATWTATFPVAITPTRSPLWGVTREGAVLAHARAFWWSETILVIGWAFSTSVRGARRAGWDESIEWNRNAIIGG